jgi:hypothetical protein
MAFNASLSAIYCDDIRQEINGKASLMGVYGTEMLFPEFPVIAPKFCVHVSLRFPANQRPTESLQINLLKDDEVIGSIAIDKETLQSPRQSPATKDLPEEERILTLQGMLVFTPFSVDAPCKIKMRADFDGKELRGNGLIIRLPTDEERAANGWPA